MPPAIRILAPAKETGDLFGRLVADLAVALGYEQPRLNIHKTGREIDLEAHHRTEPQSMRAECKATSQPIGGGDVNKFAGALDVERRRSPGEPISGYFISLSGFTESALEQEREFEPPRLTLLDGGRVVDELIAGRMIVSRARALARAGRCAAGTARELAADDRPLLLAHDIGWVWAVRFRLNAEATHLALIHADGEALSATMAKRVLDQDRDSGGELHGLTYLPPENIPPEQGVHIAEARRTYFAYLAAECGELELEGLPADQDVGARRFRLESLFVPVRLMPIHPVEPARGHANPSRDTQPQRLPLGEVLAAEPRLAILAMPGGGKTTLIKRLAVAYAFPERRTDLGDYLPDRDWFPLLLRCRQLRGRGREPITRLLGELGERAELGDRVDAFRTLVEGILREGGALLLIDGLDEIADPVERAAFVTQLRTFLSIYPGVDTVITSREAGFRPVAGVLAGHCAHYRVADFEAADVERLCVAWHREVFGSRAEIETHARKLAAAIWAADRVRRLAVNPLLLTTLLLVSRWVGQLPNRRTVLYEKAIEVLLWTWNVQGHEPLDLHEVEPQLAFVASLMIEEGEQRISQPRLQAALLAARSQMPDVLAHAKLSVHELIERVEGRSSLLVLAGHQEQDGRLIPVYEFQHLTFQEFLAAKALVDGYYPDPLPGDTLTSKLEPHFGDAAWREVIPLAAALAGRRASPLIERLLEEIDNVEGDERRVFVAANLADCLLEEVQVAPSLLERGLLAVAELILQGTRHLVYQLGCGKYGSLFRDLIWRDFTAARSDLMSLGNALAVTGAAGLGWPEHQKLWYASAEAVAPLLRSHDPRERALGLLAVFPVLSSRHKSGIAADLALARRWMPDVVFAVCSPRTWEQFSGAVALAGLTATGLYPDDPAVVIQRILDLSASDLPSDLRHVCAELLLKLRPPAVRTNFRRPPPEQLHRVVPLDEPAWWSEIGWVGAWAALFAAFYWREPRSDEELGSKFLELLDDEAPRGFPWDSALEVSNVRTILSQMDEPARAALQSFNRAVDRHRHHIERYFVRTDWPEDFTHTR